MLDSLRTALRPINSARQSPSILSKLTQTGALVGALLVTGCAESQRWIDTARGGNKDDNAQPQETTLNPNVDVIRGIETGIPGVTIDTAPIDSGAFFDITLHVDGATNPALHVLVARPDFESGRTVFDIGDASQIGPTTFYPGHVDALTPTGGVLTLLYRVPNGVLFYINNQVTTVGRGIRDWRYASAQ